LGEVKEESRQEVVVEVVEEITAMVLFSTKIT
jgi:hypothetical protein